MLQNEISLYVWDDDCHDLRNECWFNYRSDIWDFVFRQFFYFNSTRNVSWDVCGFFSWCTRKYYGNTRRNALWAYGRSEEHTSELQSRGHLVCRLLLEKTKA